MIPDFTPEDRALAEAVRKFSEARLAPRATALDEGGSVVEHLPALAAQGILGMNLPESWGGAGASALAMVLAVEEIATACAATASTVTAHFLASDAILLAGDDELKRRYLPGVAAGERVGAFALTEPVGGSDPAEMRCRLAPDAGALRLTGTKHFISNAGFADFLVVFAQGDPSAGARGIEAVVVDRTSPGVAVSSPEPTMGLKASHIYEVSFDCKVVESQRLGPARSGFKTALRTLDRGRIEVAAEALGIARAAFQAARDWSKQRKVRGGSLAELQGIQWMLAEMATSLEAARLLTYRAASLRQAGLPFTREAAMAKLQATEAASTIADMALQIHGGYGYSRRLPLERYLRDARALRIYEGASEIQRNIIARLVLQ
jgi:alkylation response protein AidB-like acyl-CoA dehydrogenase